MLALRKWPGAVLLTRNSDHYKGEIEPCDGVAVHQSVSAETARRITEQYGGADINCSVLCAEKPKSRKAAESMPADQEQ